jgi:sec-independent protein translocase protein TatC
LVCGALLASPVLLLQVWRFVAPGLYRHEKKGLLIFTVISTLCFLGGGLFGYLVVFPPAFRFLAGYSNDYLYALPTVSEYFSLSLRLLLAFGVIFELPVLMVFLAKLGIINVRFLTRHRRYAVLIAFIIAAILTPTPDVINQLLMAAPLIVLYEVGIIAVRLLVRSGSAEAVEVVPDETSGGG